MSGVLLDGAGVILLGLGLALATIGIVGLLRKDDIFHQLHAAGLVTGRPFCSSSWPRSRAAARRS
jgi:multisubunit Na+/H+ antiporter MnhG subunit